MDNRFELASYILDKDYLYNKYCELNKTAKEIAKEVSDKIGYEIEESYINNLVKILGIKKIRIIDRLTKGYLQDQYNKFGRSTTYIAKAASQKFNIKITKCYVAMLLKKYNIITTCYSMSFSEILNKEFLYKEFIELQRSTGEIAKEVSEQYEIDIKGSNVLYFLNKYNIRKKEIFSKEYSPINF